MNEVTEQTDTSATAELQLLYSTSVTPDQIDQLGHMNVRFYGVHAMVGARELTSRIGLPSLADTGNPADTAFIDLYTRHYLEQLEGAPLEVWGGVLDVGDTNIRAYFELRNPEREEFGATFVFTMQQQENKTYAPVPLTPEIIQSSKNAMVEWPEHGKPRSIDLNKDPRTLSLDKAKEFNTEAREVRVIKEKNCDTNGLYDIDSFQDLVWGSEGISDDNDWLSTLENGEKMGWATMESRCTMHQLPRAGTRIQSYRATVEVNRKAQHERFWVYDIDEGTLLCTASFVDVAFNINTRRAIVIPDTQRAKLDQYLCPDLA